MNSVPPAEDPHPDPPALRLLSTGEGPSLSWDIVPGMTIGRAEDNDVVVDNPVVSKHHCALSVKNDSWNLRDMGSSNGTYLNGKLVRNAAFKAGDTLRLGTVEFRVQAADVDGEQGFEPVMTQVLDLSSESGSFLPEQILSEDVLRKDYERLRAAHEMNRQLAIDVPLDELLERILGVIFDMIQADSGAILLEDETGNLVPRCVRSRDPGPQEGGEHQFSRTILREAFGNRKGILATDATLDHRFSGAQSVLLQGIRSVLCAPMIGSERVYGVIHLDTRGRTGAFTEKDLQILSAAARQAALALENSRLLATVEENTRTKEQLKRFLPPAIVTEMMKDRIELDRAPRELVATILFSDIRGFTSLSEKTSAPELIRLLNGYFDRMVEVVFDHGGVLDKFVGDALMAVWGTLEHEEDAGAKKAVATARDMMKALRGFNNAAGIDLHPELAIGIGINTGPLVAGFMGSRSRRLEFTVLGDTVNVASRFCSLAKAGEIVIGEETWRLIGAPRDAEFLQGVPIKGKAEPLAVYRIGHSG